ncbi:hypothetical protein SISNIDRAFT_447744 [Sistotremastrum niveocremeum HHB9708]|uniref:Uncharacterized protein n=1 Tax=Sistotremastrum niveocremeum HHB9708 TaxID=1314777 RepID=A0A165AFC8_9AGAM|nr:hypothetical protein SISNIDRAFT_447744 [Sistotremastrum niveocremeum HHB9708]
MLTSHKSNQKLYGLSFTAILFLIPTIFTFLAIIRPSASDIDLVTHSHNTGILTLNLKSKNQTLGSWETVLRELDITPFEEAAPDFDLLLSGSHGFELRKRHTKRTPEQQVVFHFEEDVEDDYSRIFEDTVVELGRLAEQEKAAEKGRRRRPTSHKS